jgi:hypothetical protein
MATKKSKSEVNYTDHAMKKSERCALCTHYIWGGGCNLVRGDISSGGWCEEFEKA